MASVQRPNNILSDPTYSIVHDRQGPQTVREKLKKLFLSHEFNIFIIVLVITDCILVVAELFLDIGALEVG